VPVWAARGRAFRVEHLHGWTDSHSEPHGAAHCGHSLAGAEAIHHRHSEELFTLPGVRSVGLGSDGIHVETFVPELVPTEVEGLPIFTERLVP
jgi:hypothetical protein